MKSGVGIYSASATRPVEFVQQTNPRLVLLSDTALELAPAIRAVCPDILIIGRRWFQYQHIPTNPAAAYQLGVEVANGLGVAANPAVGVWMSFVEYLTNNSSTAEWEAACQFELGFTHQLHRFGKQSAVLNIAVGNGTINQLRLMRAALAEADFLCYHAYTTPDGTVDLWHTERFSLWVGDYRLKGWRMPPIILTETGPYWPWKHPEQYHPDSFLGLTYLQVCGIYSQIHDIMMSHDYVVGSTAFCLHVYGQWDGFRLDEFRQQFADHFTNLNLSPTLPYCDSSKEDVLMLKDQFPNHFTEWVQNGGDQEEPFRSYLMAIGVLPVTRADLDDMVDNMKSHIQELAQIALSIPKL